jgi:uncharacterized membrane protein
MYIVSLTFDLRVRKANGRYTRASVILLLSVCIRIVLTLFYYKTVRQNQWQVLLNPFISISSLVARVTRWVGPHTHILTDEFHFLRLLRPGLGLRLLDRRRSTS